MKCMLKRSRPKFGRRGIEPKTGLNPFLKTVLNLFCIHKTDFLS